MPDTATAPVDTLIDEQSDVMDDNSLPDDVEVWVAGDKDLSDDKGADAGKADEGGEGKGGEDEGKKPDDEKKEPEETGKIADTSAGSTAPAAKPFVAPAKPVEIAPVDHFEAIGIKKDDTLGRKLNEAYLTGGIEEVNRFMKAYGTDWSKVSDMDVVRQSIEQKYKDLDTEDRDYMVKRDLSKYDTSSFDEDEARAVRIQLKLEAKAIRDGYKAEQSNYKVPDRNATDPEETARQQAAEFEQRILTDPFLSKFETDKRVTVGTGKEAFNYALPDVDLKSALSVPFDEHFITRDKDGNATGIKLDKYAKALAFVNNEEDFMAKIAEHYMSLGEKRKDAKLRNIGRAGENAAPETASSAKWISG